MPLLALGAVGAIGSYFLADSLANKLIKFAVVGGVAYYAYTKVK